MVQWVSAVTRAGLTGVSIVQDHLAVAGLRPGPANCLQAKPNPGAGLQVRQDEHQIARLVPQGHLLCDVVRSIEVEGGEEEEGELAVLRTFPGQRYAAAVPRRHLKVLGGVWVWWKEGETIGKVFYNLPLTDFLGHMRDVETSCKHRTYALAPLKYSKLNSCLFTHLENAALR